MIRKAYESPSRHLTRKAEFMLQNITCGLPDSCIPLSLVSRGTDKEMANHRGGSGNFAEDRERASEAGRKGGQHSGGNFKNDPQRASEAGKKGGKNSHGSSK
ncbi:hypothetical protein L1887_45039 [Cichorium endivia]|nr:hypothetical protein L1887_45039 [Cichorium endivia]